MSVNLVSSVSVSPVSCPAPVPGTVAVLASGADASFLCVRPSASSFSGWVCAVLFSSRAAASGFARAAAARFGFPFCVVRSCGAWFSASVPCFVSEFSASGVSSPCLWCSLLPAAPAPVAAAAPVPAPAAGLRPLFSGLRSVGFSGSRSPKPAAASALRAVLPLVPAGCRVSVGCARGVDSAVQSFFGGSASLLVFSVAGGRFGSGRSAFARRSSRCVLSVAAGCRGLLVALPSAPVPPAGVRPSRSFFGGGSGSWGSAAFALGRGRRVLLWLAAGSRPPVWSGVSWSSAGGGSAGCWWLGVPVRSAMQLSLF